MRKEWSADKKGKCHWTNGIEERWCKECPGEGWLKMTLKEYKCRSHSTGKNVHWTNGNTVIWCKECPR